MIFFPVSIYEMAFQFVLYEIRIWARSRNLLCITKGTGRQTVWNEHWIVQTILGVSIIPKVWYFVKFKNFKNDLFSISSYPSDKWKKYALLKNTRILKCASFKCQYRHDLHHGHFEIKASLGWLGAETGDVGACACSKLYTRASMHAGC